MPELWTSLILLLRLKPEMNSPGTRLEHVDSRILSIPHHAVQSNDKLNDYTRPELLAKKIPSIDVTK